MRKTFSEITDQIIREDEKTVLLLGDIGVFAFRKTIEDFPLRAMNFGIMEQTMISFASGLAKEKFIPIVHTIAPFLVERAYEQLKVDFGYQQLGGNFISVGASNDYSSLGCTHHCPGDVGNLLNIPEMEIVTPGTSLEFKTALLERYGNSKPTYFRLSEKENEINNINAGGKGVKIKNGTLATVLAIGPTLNLVLESTKNYDVEIIYLNHIRPIDHEILINNCKSNKILIIEPFYECTINFLINRIFETRFPIIMNLGIERNLMKTYGSSIQMDAAQGFTPKNLQSKLETLINAK
jgi:transketolase